MDSAKAFRDFGERIKYYEEAYQSLDDEEGSYAKLIDLGNQLIVNRIKEHLQSRIVFFVMNLHIRRRSIFLCRHGETIYNVNGRIGGNAELSNRGNQFAKELPIILKNAMQESGAEGDWSPDESVQVWTSTLKRTIQTASHLNYPVQQWKALDELDAGVCDGLTYEEIDQKYPHDQKARDQNKLRYRYRGGGESYYDLIVRLEPIILEMERTENLLIIGHQAILRVILGYLMGVELDEIPYLKVPLHVIVRVTPTPYGCEIKEHTSQVEAVNTHRLKPN
jgi:6-phosphofructo-2-kinase / fructose-2,6-biphosphatase 2